MVDIFSFGSFNPRFDSLGSVHHISLYAEELTA